MLEVLQKSFRVTLGATASLVETLQDNQKRDELKIELEEKINELAEKGATTEQELRKFVENFKGVSNNSPSSSTPITIDIDDEDTTPKSSQNSAQEIKDLTDEISSLRAELEELRRNKSNDSSAE